MNADTLFFLIWFCGALWIGWRCHAAYARSSRYDINTRGTHYVNRILRRL